MYYQPNYWFHLTQSDTWSKQLARIRALILILRHLSVFRTLLNENVKFNPLWLFISNKRSLVLVLSILERTQIYWIQISAYSNKNLWSKFCFFKCFICCPSRIVYCPSLTAVLKLPSVINTLIEVWGSRYKYWCRRVDSCNDF